MTNIDRALTIDGWMTKTEITWLAQQASNHKVIVELGSYLGRSTRALADNTPGVVYAIDKWTSSDELPLYDFELEVFFARFKRNVSDLIECGKCIPIVADHRNGISIGVRPDMVFIDGSHVYENVRDDLIKWLPRLDGLFCGHDYVDFPDVQQAVTEILGEVHVVPNTNIWWKECI